MTTKYTNLEKAFNDIKVIAEEVKKGNNITITGIIKDGTHKITITKKMIGGWRDSRITISNKVYEETPFSIGKLENALQTAREIAKFFDTTYK